jgi:polyhydroxyalkanoate synthase
LPDDETSRKVEFYTKQFVDALAPSNFLATNPEVLSKTLETGGENLLSGLTNLLNDLQRGKGRLALP